MRSLRNVWSCNTSRLIAVCACIVAGVGCDGGKLVGPDGRPSDTNTTVVETVRVEFGGRVVNADTGGPVGNVRVSLYVLSHSGSLTLYPSDFPKDTATSGGDGAFTLPLNLPSLWKFVSLELTGPPGYDDTSQRYERIGPLGDPFRPTAAERPAIRMYPTIMIRPGESIEVRVDSSINVWCGWGGEGGPCRRVQVGGSPGDPVELELVPDDSSKPMGLSPDNSGATPVRRLMVPPGGVPYVIGDGTARLTAHR